MYLAMACGRLTPALLLANSGPYPAGRVQNPYYAPPAFPRAPPPREAVDGHPDLSRDGSCTRCVSYASSLRHARSARLPASPGFSSLPLKPALFAAPRESANVPWNTASRWCAITAVLVHTSFRKLRLWLTTRIMPGDVWSAVATTPLLS